MSEGSAKKKKATSVDEFVAQNKQQAKQEEKREQKQETATTSEFADIESNVFFNILLNSELSALEKKSQVAKALTFEEGKEEARQKLDAFNLFKEYLQFERKRMAREIINLTDTEAFSELKQVYEDINTALLDFEERISPLTDIVDAVYTLRMNDMTFDIFREIAEDREAEEERERLREEQETSLNRLENEISDLQRRNAELGEEKAFFGLGGIKQSARQKIAVNKVTLDEKAAELAALTADIEEAANAAARDTDFAEFSEEKAKLRELLDISSDEHKERQQALVDAARSFIDVTEARVAGVLGHFNGMNDQIDRLGDANYTMREIYAVLNDATDEAADSNQKNREDLNTPQADEGDIQTMERERRLRDLENHITALNQSNVDTTNVFAELTSTSHRIKTMKDGNDQQVSKTRALHTSGVAGVADQLSTVLQAVSSAALGESSEMAKISLERMHRTTSELGQKEVIRVALGTQEMNEDLTKALADLEQYGDVIRTATGITREGLTETKRLLNELEETAHTVHDDIKEATGVAADVVAGKGGAPKSNEDGDGGGDGEAEAPKPRRPNPFGIGSDS